MNTLIGWDLSRGAGSNAVPLGSPDQPGQAVLYRPEIPGAAHACVDLATQIDVFNLDPRLTLVATFWRQLCRNRPLGANPRTAITGTIDARAIVGSENPSEPPIELYTIPTTELWRSSGALDDGCELTTGMQGIRFRLGVTVDSAPLDHEVVASLTAIPNVALGCRELAEAIVRRLVVRIPAPLVIPWADVG